MKTFLGQALSEGENPSSKRVICFLLLLLFSTIALVNLFTQKAVTSEIQSQLYYLLSMNILAILGGNAIDAWKDTKLKTP